MKKIILLSLLLCSAMSYAQEEFYDNKGGISLGYQKAYLNNTTIDADALGLSIVTNSGFILSPALSLVNEEATGSLAFGYMTKAKEKNAFARAYLAAGPYLYSKVVFWGFTIGGAICLNTQTEFPSSINLSFGYTSGKGSSTISPYETNSGMYIPSTIAYGVQISQAFFSNNAVYPIISCGYAENLSQATEDALPSVSISFGLNFSISKLSNME